SGFSRQECRCCWRGASLGNAPGRWTARARHLPADRSLFRHDDKGVEGGAGAGRGGVGAADGRGGGDPGQREADAAAGVGAAADRGAVEVLDVADFVALAGGEDLAQVDTYAAQAAPVVDGDVGAAGFVLVGPHDHLGAGGASTAGGIAAAESAAAAPLAEAAGDVVHGPGRGAGAAVVVIAGPVVAAAAAEDIDQLAVADEAVVTDGGLAPASHAQG